MLTSPSLVVGSPGQGGGPQDPKTVAATKGPFAVVHEFTGSFDAPDVVEVAYRPQAYQGVLEVAEAAAPGPVKKGQLLVRFATARIDEQIEDARLELAIASTNLRRMTEEAKRKEEAHAIEMESAKAAFENAKQAYATFKDVLMPMQIAEAALGLQASKDRLQESEEEFVQLQKMYKSDDLVEETEEIVLRRAKRSLEQRRTQMTFTERRHKLRVEEDIPRELRSKELEFRQATNTHALTKATAELRLEQAAAELQKAKLKLARQERAFADLERDRAALTIEAPADGVAVPGWLVKGKWTGIDKNTKTLRPGEKAAANDILFSIVTPGPKVVQTSVPESVVLDVKPGMAAEVAPAATPNATLAAKFVRVARVSADGNFDAWLEVATPHANLIAGNACKVTVTTAEIADAVTVPATAVGKDGARDVVHVVKDGKVEVRVVQIGATAKGRTVIRSGLADGEQILASPPGRKE